MFMKGKRVLIRHRSGGTWILDTSVLRAISSDLWCLWSRKSLELSDSNPDGLIELACIILASVRGYESSEQPGPQPTPSKLKSGSIIPTLWEGQSLCYSPTLSSLLLKPITCDCILAADIPTSILKLHAWVPGLQRWHEPMSVSGSPQHPSISVMFSRTTRDVQSHERMWRCTEHKQTRTRRVEGPNTYRLREVRQQEKRHWAKMLTDIQDGIVHIETGNVDWINKDGIELKVV